MKDVHRTVYTYIGLQTNVLIILTWNWCKWWQSVLDLLLIYFIDTFDRALPSFGQTSSSKGQTILGIKSLLITAMIRSLIEQTRPYLLIVCLLFILFIASGIIHLFPCRLSSLTLLYCVLKSALNVYFWNAWPAAGLADYARSYRTRLLLDRAANVFILPIRR